ncbi:Iron import ATP-binding/permease protein IrtA [Actinomadura madurae]|nr:Iron import ATP-binding/permease protein IrtA [Actinomadura madurae]
MATSTTDTAPRTGGPDGTGRDAPAQAEAGAKRSGPGLGAILAPVRGRVTAAALLRVIGALATLVPYVAVAEIGRVLLRPGPADESAVWRWVAIAVGGLLAGTACSGIAYTLTHIADADAGLHLRRRVAARLGRVPMGWFTDRGSGRVKRVLQDDVHAVHHLVAHALNDLVGAVVTPVAILAYLFWVDWRLALVCIAPLLLYVVAYGWMMRDAAAQMAKWSEALSRLNAAVVEFVAGIAVVKTFGQTHRAQDRYRRAGDDLADFFGRWVGPMLRVEAVSSLIIAPPVMLLVAAGASAWFVGEGWIGPAEALPFLMLAVGLGTPVMTLGFGAQAMRTATEAAGRLGELLSTAVLTSPEEPRAPQGSRVEFDGVGFSYDGRTTVLDGIDLVLEPGTVTALVGASGSGKSTLARLLPRFWDPGTGHVRIGGVDLRDMAETDLYRQVGFVFQETSLLRASVRDNIRLARPDAAGTEVEAAARAAQIHDRIARLPRGYDAVVHEDAELSGGEAQRVAIARALLADAPVLVLDEATAFADPECEAAVQDALSELVAGRTLLVIAHRLHTITGADQIVVMDGGRIAETGRHADLLRAGGVYTRLWNAQSAASPETTGTEETR